MIISSGCCPPITTAVGQILFMVSAVCGVIVILGAGVSMVMNEFDVREPWWFSKTVSILILVMMVCVFSGIGCEIIFGG